MTGGKSPLGTAGERRTHWEGEPVSVWEALWEIPTLEAWSAIGSTNDRARELAREGAAPFTTVLAERQLRGRGRSGRSWASPPGKGLWLSVVVHERIRDARLLAPLLAGVGVCRAVERVAPELETRLKWPNDVMLGDRKVAGILCEGAGDAVVVGVGINVRPLADDAPEDVREGGTSLDEATGQETALHTVADAVVAGIEGRATHPPASLEPDTLDALDRYDWLQDRRVEITTPSDEEWIIGNCVGIAPDGALLFRPDRGALRRLRDARIRVP